MTSQTGRPRAAFAPLTATETRFAPPAPEARTSPRAAAAASLVGAVIEWYDFQLYGTAAALIFNKLYFPTFDPRVGTLAAFGTSAMGFAARPIGAAVIGHFGDRIGRKSMLVFTLVVMGAASCAIGLLPTYAAIGPRAAVALVVLRFVQGFAVGGEWGGAALMAVEHAPVNRRGFYGSWVEMGAPLGVVLATAAFASVARLPEAQLLAWGWRIPFLASALLVAVGLVIRLRVTESPVFERMKATKARARTPLLELLRTEPKQLLLLFLMKVGLNSAFYIYTVFMIVYGMQIDGFTRRTMLNVELLASVCMVILIPGYGALTDRIGRRPVYLFGACLMGVFAYPLFVLFDTRSTVLMAVGLIIALAVSQGALAAPQSAFYSELFSARVRYTGGSLGSQLGSAFGGGISTLVALTLMPLGRGAIASYLIAGSLVTVGAAFAAKETRGRSLDE